MAPSDEKLGSRLRTGMAWPTIAALSVVATLIAFGMLLQAWLSVNGSDVVEDPSSETSTPSVSVPISLLAWIAFGVSVVGLLLWLGLVLSKGRVVPLKIALSGQPGAGKTVLANLLFDRMMGTEERRVRFTAEAATVISVYQAIRNLGVGDWPIKTEGESVFRYLGVVDFHSRIAPIKVPLEITDTAGENWIDMVTGSEARNEETYLEHVISSDAMIHVVSSEVLEMQPARLREFAAQEVRDLQLARRLMRSADPAGRAPRLLMDFSKMDLLVGEEAVVEMHGLGLLRDATMSGEIFALGSLIERLSRIRRRISSPTFGSEEVVDQLGNLIEFLTALDPLRRDYSDVEVMFSSAFPGRMSTSTLEISRSAAVLGGRLLAWLGGLTIEKAPRTGVQALLLGRAPGDRSKLAVRIIRVFGRSLPA